MSGSIPNGRAVATFLALMLIAAAADFMPAHGRLWAQERERRVVLDDAGGPLVERLAEVARLRAAGVAVEIRGRYCLSSCTLYLGLPDVCVLPQTEFGFHGPSSPVYGIALPPQQFEYWSQVMAAHYPATLRGWFLREARLVTMGFLRLHGSDLIAMGISACAPDDRLSGAPRPSAPVTRGWPQRG